MLRLKYIQYVEISSHPIASVYTLEQSQQPCDEWAAALYTAFRQVLQTSLPNNTAERADVEPSIRGPELISVHGKITPLPCK